MTNQSRQEYLQSVRFRYHGATKQQKQAMLDEFCATSGYNRKYAIRLLNEEQKPSDRKEPARRGRKKTYDDPMIEQFLRDLWRATNLACAKRLVAMIPLWLPHYDKFVLDQEIIDKLLSISAATIDRTLRPFRARDGKCGLATTKPGSIIKKHIPVKTNQWHESVPGFLEADTVAHCGNSTAGQFVFTVNCVDIATGWTEQRAVWGKGQHGVIQAIENIELNLPFAIKGFDCDNGSEFLNWHLIRHLTERKRPVQFTRARAYHKNDNAHIENKNWTHVRQYLGYQRFQHQALVEKLNHLYTTEWNIYFNFFIPSVKLIAKNRVGSKVVKTYDKPKTPMQRLIESEHISTEQKQQLTKTLEQLNPFQLQQRMYGKIKTILKEVDRCLNTPSNGNPHQTNTSKTKKLPTPHPALTDLLATAKMQRQEH